MCDRTPPTPLHFAPKLLTKCDRTLPKICAIAFIQFHFIEASLNSRRRFSYFCANASPISQSSLAFYSVTFASFSIEDNFACCASLIDSSVIRNSPNQFLVNGISQLHNQILYSLILDNSGDRSCNHFHSFSRTISDFTDTSLHIHPTQLQHINSRNFH